MQGLGKMYACWARPALSAEFFFRLLCLLLIQLTLTELHLNSRVSNTDTIACKNFTLLLKLKFKSPGMPVIIASIDHLSGQCPLPTLLLLLNMSLEILVFNSKLVCNTKHSDRWVIENKEMKKV